ncbi:MAG: crossover junction endodeoxyribonuclease RuvC [Candidatus Moranbacteria bacterium]|nr:crossover junction endodeoxyribonuclease RuvC [Candidatus Moranbacteria bacterium]
MITLGLDPGFARAGYGIVEKNGNQIKLVDCGCIITEPKTTFCDRLVQIADDLEELIDKFKPDHCAIESLFFFKNTKTAISVASARGVMILVPRKKNIMIFEYTPLQIKQALTGYGKAEKNQITKMVQKIIGVQNSIKLDDTSDAIAAAICHLNSFRLDEKLTKK